MPVRLMGNNRHVRPVRHKVHEGVNVIEGYEAVRS